MNPTIRIFLAIDIHEPFRSLLTHVQQHLRKNLTGCIKWVEISNIHLTIKFVGALNPAHIQLIGSNLYDEISLIRPFTLQPSGIGIFPNPRHPRVVWLGVNQPPQLMQIVEIVEKTFTVFNYSKEKRRFSPHLTIARIRESLSEVDHANLHRAIQDFSWSDDIYMAVNEIKLYRSQLTPSGPVYKELLRVGLMGFCQI